MLHLHMDKTTNRSRVRRMTNPDNTLETYMICGFEIFVVETYHGITVIPNPLACDVETDAEDFAVRHAVREAASRFGGDH